MFNYYNNFIFFVSCAPRMHYSFYFEASVSMRIHFVLNKLQKVLSHLRIGFIHFFFDARLKRKKMHRKTKINLIGNRQRKCVGGGALILKFFLYIFLNLYHKSKPFNYIVYLINWDLY